MELDERNLNSIIEAIQSSADAQQYIMRLGRRRS